MMHTIEGHYWGMHWFWWILWVIMIVWIFAIPADIPGQRKKKDSPLDVLKKRYAAGEIDTKEYEERKRVLEDGK
jgi:putative membrane protein